MSEKRSKEDRVLSIRDLNIAFETASGTVNAIRGVRMDYIATINGGCLVKRDGTVVDKWPMSEKTMDELTNLCIKNGIGLGFKFEDAVVTYANHGRSSL